ncbi:MAG: hypothetical protein FWG47_02170 [Propionibacteriaceae bacterium]|nr:hypothetical protein [Propionibacteriaceae bacterium]
MELTGLIFGVVAAAWLVYLVPYFLQRRGLPEDQVDEAFSTTAITIVRNGSDLASTDDGLALDAARIQKSKLEELTRIDRRAATRRRSVLVFLLAVQIGVAVLVVCGLGQWWFALIPTGLIATFLVISRVTVRRMRRKLASRAAELRSDENADTMTVQLADNADHEHSIELSLPLPKLESLWEPIAITRPTYVSQPLAPRTVRTIDLNAAIGTTPGIPISIDDTDSIQRNDPRLKRRNVG